MLSLPKGIQGPKVDSDKLARVLCFCNATLPAQLLRARAAISAACPAPSVQGGYICSLPGSFEPGRLICSLPGSLEPGRSNLQPARLSRARAAISPACQALEPGGGYICSLPGSFEPGRPSLQPARLFPDLTSRTYLNITGYETGYEALAGYDTGHATGM